MTLVKRHKQVFLGLFIGIIVPWMKRFIIDNRGDVHIPFFVCPEPNFIANIRNDYGDFTNPPGPQLRNSVTNSGRLWSFYETTQGVPSTKSKEVAQEKDPTTSSPNSDPLTVATLEEGRRIRLLCWFMTDPNILEKTKSVQNTWTKDCDIRLFVSSQWNPNFPTVGVNVSSGRPHIAAKSRAAWGYVYRHYLDQADYFMKSDPDSYVMVENLKWFLANRNTNDPEAYGHALYYGRPTWLGNFSGFYTAGQSVVLTRESLIRLTSKGIDTRYFVDGQAEDLKTIVCIEKKGGYLIDTRDIYGRETFMPAIGLASTLSGKIPDWYSNYYRRYLGYCQEKHCLSQFPIVFHYITSEMYILDYLTRGMYQKQHRKAFVEDSLAQGYFKFNGSIFAKVFPDAN